MIPSADRPLGDVEYQALARFRHHLRRFLRFSERAAQAEGLTPAQHQLLLAIRGHPPGRGSPSIGDLAGVLMRRTHSVVGLVDRAEQKRLVVSHPDPADARRRLVDLTERGTQILERLSELHRRELRSFQHDLMEVFRDLH
ncbi:MAG: MarR family transcriptional regulator [Acidimicrobiia bacterium]